MCIIAGGETTVTVRGTGKGGRNQELALVAVIEIDGMPGVVILSAGTDGPTDAAGAIVNERTVFRAMMRGNVRARSSPTMICTISSSR